MTGKLKWLLVVGLVLVFLAGAATGLFAGAWHARSAFHERHGRFMGERMREHITRQLDLSPAQAREVEPILEETARQVQTIQAETRTRVTEAMEQARGQLAVHLTPAQVEKMERMKKRHLRIMRGRHFHRHHPPPSPHAP